MRKLGLSDWAHVAEIIASIVIVVSLLYVGQELNQNTNSIQQSSYQSTLDNLIQGDLLLASDAELNDIVSRAEQDPDLVSEQEWSRFSRYALARFGVWEYVFAARESDSISETQWGSFSPYFEFLVCNTGYSRFFAENRAFYGESFLRYVDSVSGENC